tara:strand:- start:73 stop:327 length:255 start_codon:yes stop_codon:yes gene_type:complete
MKFNKLIKLISLIIFINVIYADKLRSETKTHAIIKIFCKESVKSEYKKNNFEYKESIGDDVCNCYLENISKNISHKESIIKCKL